MQIVLMFRYFMFLALLKNVSFDSLLTGKLKYHQEWTKSDTGLFFIYLFHYTELNAKIMSFSTV